MFPTAARLLRLAPLAPSRFSRGSLFPRLGPRTAAAPISTHPTTTMAGLTDLERFHFDLNGYVVVRGALSAAEVESLNRAVDANVGDAVERVGTELRNTQADTPLAGDGASGRIDLAGMLGWEQPHCTGFRELLAHPNLVGKINDLCGG